MWRMPGIKYIMEDVHEIIKFRRFLPDRGRKGRGLVQFWAEQGGLRTIDVSDVVEVK